MSQASECCCFRAHTPHLSVHEAIFCRLHPFLHRVGLPVMASLSKRCNLPVPHLCRASAFLFLFHHSHHSFHHVLRVSLVCCRTRCRCGDHFFTLLIFACWLLIASCVVLICTAAPANYPLVWSRIVPTWTSISRFVSSHFLASPWCLLVGPAALAFLLAHRWPSSATGFSVFAAAAP